MALKVNIFVRIVNALGIQYGYILKIKRLRPHILKVIVEES